MANMKLLAVFGLLAVIALAHANQSKVGNDSCEGRCDTAPDGSDCNCNDSCTSFNDCCDDYAEICLGGTDPGSCAGRCGPGDSNEFPCQCNTPCVDYGDCCPDYEEECGEGTGSGEVTDAALQALSERLLLLDINNAGSLVDIDFQGTTNNCGPDNAPDPMFSRFEESIWNIDTVSKLRALYDNFEPDEDVSEDHTAEEEAEEYVFLDAVLSTPVMLEAYDFLFSNGVFTGDAAAFRAKLYDLWFGMYRRGTTDSSSGFEHVFMGEIDGGDVGGFHSWLHYREEEEKGNINYHGYITSIDFGGFGMGITNVHTWLGSDKCIGGFFVGTSPELDFAVKSVCSLTRAGRPCNLSYAGQNFYIQTYTQFDDGVEHIGTAYPVFD